MTDINKYRSLAVSHDTYDKIGKIAKNLAPGVTLSRAQTVKVIVDEKVKPEIKKPEEETPPPIENDFEIKLKRLQFLNKAEKCIITTRYFHLSGNNN